MSTETEEARNKALVQRFFDEIDEHNLEAMDDLLADDYTTGVFRSGSGEAISGREGTKELWAEYWEAFPDLEGESTELIAEGNRVAVFREERGTHDGEFRGVAPTGNEITFEYAGYVVVEDGEIVHGHFIGSIMDLLRQMDVELPIPR